MRTFGFSIGMASASRPAGTPSPTPTPSAPISAVAANGWQATMLVPADLSFAGTSLTRQGYDSSGATATINESLATTKRVRQVYPSQAALTAADVALSDYVYSTDSIAGVTNNSAETSPKPVANWVVIGRDVVGNSLTVELVAFHRNGIAAIVGTASDGTSSVTATTSAAIVLGAATDRNAVIGYRLTFDITSLADQSAITVNAKVYPRIGGAASVLDSAGVTAESREFSGIVFAKHVARAAAPVYVYVDATAGVDATVNAAGAASAIQKVSTDPAVAAANPFQSLGGTNGAARALIAATTLTGGVTSGCIIRVVGTANSSSNWTTGTYQNANGGALYIEGVDSASTVSQPSGNDRQLYTIYRNIKITRTTTTGLRANRMRNVILDNASQTTALLATGQILRVNGLTITNVTGSSVFGVSANYEFRMVRGLDVSGTVPAAMDFSTVVGSLFQNGAAFNDLSTRTAMGGIVAFNRAQKLTQGPFTIAQSYSVDRLALVQNLFEHIGTGTSDTNRFGGDSGLGNVTSLICWNNTFVGYDIVNRHNWAYVDGTFASGAQSRAHKLWSVRSNIFTQMNMKGDVFVGTNNNGTPDPTNAPNAIGNWSQRYGVGWIGNWT